MHAIALENGHYSFRDVAIPIPAADEILIKVAYAGINRADLFQKQGRYPLPEMSPAIPGLEVSGEVEKCGANVHDYHIGDRVCALLAEGGYAQYVTAPAALALRVPENLSLQDAAALPEACFTVWLNFIALAQLKAGESVLIHGGTGGVASIAIQIARRLGARVFTTAGTAEKCELCKQLGADIVINHQLEDYVSIIKEATHGNGVDVILDVVGGDYFERNLACLAMHGRLCILSFLKGAKVTTSLSPILLKQLRVMGSTLRSQSLEQKAFIAAQLRSNIWKDVERGAIKPVIDQIFPLKEAEKALYVMDQGLNIGKILLKM